MAWSLDDRLDENRVMGGRSSQARGYVKEVRTDTNTINVSGIRHKHGAHTILLTSSICRISEVYFFAKVYTFSIKYILF